MKYSVELRTRVEGTGVIQFNEFNGKHKLEERIHKWIYEVRKEYGYREMVVESVKVNDKEITEKLTRALKYGEK
jgi:hypothetical protein